MIEVGNGILAFDLETASTWAEGESPDPKSGMGITCMGFATPTERSPRTWSCQSDTEHGEKRMSKPAARDVLLSLVKAQAGGATIVSWNGLFDWHVLGVEAGDLEMAAFACLRHVDLMLAFHGIQGYPLSLKAAAEAVGSHKGGGGIDDGAMAPELWEAGEYDRVLEYVKQDAVATLDVALHLREQKGFVWRTRSGKQRAFRLPRHLAGLAAMRVCDVAQWPEPNQSWQNTPLLRKDMLAWVNDARL